jgi:carbon monoxide dehydrogenase subunit G
MELQGERLIPASVDTTWAALNDPEVLKACIAGCESLERTGEDSLVAVVALKVGPVSARFKGNLNMTNVQPPNSYTINFDGQGGVAGFGKGSADVALTPEGDLTRLKYTARATVGGKMAQIGSRLIDATAAKITEDFFKAFEVKLQPPAAPEQAVVAVSEPVKVTEPDGGVAKLWWLIGAIIVLAVVYFMIRGK